MTSKVLVTWSDQYGKPVQETPLCGGLTPWRMPCQQLRGHEGDCSHYTYSRYFQNVTFELAGGGQLTTKVQY